MSSAPEWQALGTMDLTATAIVLAYHAGIGRMRAWRTDHTIRACATTEAAS